MAQRSVGDADVVAVAVLDLRTPVFVVDLDVTELRAVRRAQQQVRTVIDQL